MIRINLLAAERPTQKKKAAAAPGATQAYLLLGLLAGGTALACGALYFYKQSQLATLDRQIAAAEEKQRKLQDIKKQVEELEKKRATHQRKVDLIETLKAEQSGPVHLLDEVSKALPEFVWLTQMQQTGANVSFSGQSSSYTAVADFILALQRSGWFPSVDLKSTEEDKNIVKFSLTSVFKDPVVAAREKEAAAKAKEAAAKLPPPPPGKKR